MWQLLWLILLTWFKKCKQNKDLLGLVWFYSWKRTLALASIISSCNLLHSPVFAYYVEGHLHICLPHPPKVGVWPWTLLLGTWAWISALLQTSSMRKSTHFNLCKMRIMTLFSEGCGLFKWVNTKHNHVRPTLSTQYKAAIVITVSL